MFWSRRPVFIGHIGYISFLFTFNADITNHFRCDVHLFGIREDKNNILTHLAYIANDKKSCSILQQFTGRKCVTLLVAVL